MRKYIDYEAIRQLREEYRKMLYRYKIINSLGYKKFISQTLTKDQAVAFVEGYLREIECGDIEIQVFNEMIENYFLKDEKLRSFFDELKIIEDERKEEIVFSKIKELASILNRNLSVKYASETLIKNMDCCRHEERLLFDDFSQFITNDVATTIREMFYEFGEESGIELKELNEYNTYDYESVYPDDAVVIAVDYINTIEPEFLNTLLALDEGTSFIVTMNNKTYISIECNELQDMNLYALFGAILYITTLKGNAPLVKEIA